MRPLHHYLQRARVAYQETGPRGLARRAVRVGLSRLARQLDSFERDLFYAEARARLGDEVRAAARATTALRDSRRGQRAFVLATGPSLNAPGVDLRPLADEVTIGVNSFYLHPIVKQWQPTYLAVTDHEFFLEKNSPISFFNAVRGTLSSSEFFVPAQFIPKIRQAGWLPLERVHGVAMDGDFGEHLWDDIDPTLLPSPPNVVMFALAMALYMGCSPVVLLGADNDWLARPLQTNNPIGHFYDESELDIASMDAPRPPLDPRALREGFDISLRSLPVAFVDYHRVIEYCRGLWRGYKNLHYIATQRGQVVLNASPGSYLDVFPSTTLADVLARR